ncbi:MAG: FHA domain-containing protein [Planctomycetia bacterium]|nr:FHA domain-containing protein [Planctomycetia bacterium]
MNLSTITLRIIDGNDKGQVYESLPSPVRLGREAQNTIQLHDEKISRYHCKIQESDGEWFLTDIDSTNGTQLNGQPVRIATLHVGDLIALGQTLIIVGARKEIAQRLVSLENLNLKNAALRLLVAEDAVEFLPTELIDELESYSYDVKDAMRRLHCILPPELPKGLQPVQMAEMAEMFLYFQLRLRMLVESAKQDDVCHTVSWDTADWQCFLDIFSRITTYSTQLTDPER